MIEQYEVMPKRHAQSLLPMIHTVLAEAVSCPVWTLLLLRVGRVHLPELELQRVPRFGIWCGFATSVGGFNFGGVSSRQFIANIKMSKSLLCWMHALKEIRLGYGESYAQSQRRST